MSRLPPRDQVRRAFSELTRPPSPQLDERIRSSLWRRRPRASGGARRRVPGVPLGVPVVPLAAALVLVALVAAAVLEGPSLVGAASRGLSSAGRLIALPTTAATQSPQPSGTPQAVVPSPTATPIPTVAPTPTPAPTAAPLVTPVALSGFSCAAQSGGSGQGTMTTARVGTQTGYDRFVVEFSGGVPQFDVQLQGTATFGATTLQGAAGLSVVLHDATGAGAYGGPTDAQPGFALIREARLLSDSGGVVQWGIGISRPACFHAWVLSSPSRLVIDVSYG